MTGRASCRGAATIVNAIPTGKGAAFGITLQVDAEVELTVGPGREVDGPAEGADLVIGCVDAVLRAGRNDPGGFRVRLGSDIPISRGLKSSSAASNAVVLAAARAIGLPADDMWVISTAVDESLKAGVTVTGAFDDATACYLGGAVVTDNRERRIISRGAMDPDLSVVIHVPEGRIPKSSVKDLDFGPARAASEAALAHALAGEYAKAMEINSKACSEVLGLSEDVALLARERGAVAAGVTGTGPATVVLSKREDVQRLKALLEREFEGIVLVASINDTPAPEVEPRLL